MLKKFINNTDVIYKETRDNCIICYQEQLCNILDFIKNMYQFIRTDKEAPLDLLFPGICKKIEYNEEKMEQMIYSGLLLAYRNGIYYAFDLAKPPSRGVTDSILEPESPFQARDGFVENFKENIALIRTRIRDNNLIINSLMIGKRSKTNVSILSIKDIHNKEILDNILNDLNKLDTDAITSCDEVSKMFQGNNIFPMYQYVGSPDIAVRRLLNGEFVIVIDRLSLVLVVPITISITTRMAVDGLNIPLFTIFEKLFIIFAFFFSTIFLGFLCSITTYQADLLSLRIISILKITQKGVFIPLIYEILIVLTLFEMFYVIIFRQSKITISGAILLIGGLIIGENLVTSGIAGVFIITFTAISFLMSFLISNNVTVLASISIFRIITVFSSYYLGIYGVFLMMILAAYLMYKQKIYDVYYFYPFVPFSFKGIIKSFRSTSSFKNNNRNTLMRTNDKIRKDIK